MASWGAGKLVLGPVVVDRDLDAELLDHLLDDVEGLGLRSGHHQGKAGLTRVLEGLAHLRRVVLEGDRSAAHDR